MYVEMNILYLLIPPYPKLDTSIKPQQIDVFPVLPVVESALCGVQGFRVTLLEALASNSSMASTLGSFRALTGDWRRVVQDLDTVRATSQSRNAEKNPKRKSICPFLANQFRHSAQQMRATS